MTLINSEKLIRALALDKKIMTMLLNNSDQSNKFLLDCNEFMKISDDVDLNPVKLKETSELINAIYDNVIDKINNISQSRVAGVIEYNITLYISEQEKKDMEERMKNDGSSPEIWIKKAICAFSDGLLFCGDDVWCRPSEKPVRDSA